MKLQTKILALSAVFVADLFFFLFFIGHYPGLFKLILRWLPWQDDIEKGIIILVGFLIAVLTPSGLMYILAKEVQKRIK